MPDQIKPEINTNRPTMEELMAANPTPQKQFYDHALMFWELVYAHESDKNKPLEEQDGNQA